VKKIKILVIEDSILMQRIIDDIFEHQQDFEVVAKVSDAAQAMEKIPQLRPDIVTLDLQLPDVQSLKLIEEIVKKYSTKILALSGHHSQAGEIAIKALELGALDFLPKPTDQTSFSFYDFKDELIKKIRSLAGTDIDSYLSAKSVMPVATKENTRIEHLVVIAASTGGPQVIIEIMSQMPPDINAAFLVIQHMPKGFTGAFVSRLSHYCQLKVRQAKDKAVLYNGYCYIAPAGYHLVLKENNYASSSASYCLHLKNSSLVNYVKPSADVTMFSAAQLLKNKVIAVVLTGMGKDGLEGARRVKEEDGFVVVQDKKSSLIYGMPAVIAEEKLADKILNCSAIASEIKGRCQ
jgi:two-component system chemotaxis response regulator CheB